MEFIKAAPKQLASHHFCGAVREESPVGASALRDQWRGDPPKVYG